MPYSNVPVTPASKKARALGDQTGKMDSCVKKVMAQGHSKESAIRICHASIVGKATMTIQKKVRRAADRKRAAQRQVDDLEHKAELTAQAAADAKARLEEESGAEPETTTAGEPAPSEKSGAAAAKWMDDAWQPYGGATTLTDALAIIDAQDRAQAIRDAAWLFQDVTSNILGNPSITDKGAAIAVAAGELQALLNDPTPLMKDLAATPIEPAASAPTTEPPATGTLAQSLAIQNAMDGATAAKSEPAPLTQPGTFQVFKGLDGGFYALGRMTNKWRDVDYAQHPKGEILTEAAHKEFMAWLDEHPDQAPELWTWHTPGTARKHRAEWWAYADGFVSLLWPLEESEAKQFTPDETLAMSHGFYALARNAADGLITKYRTFEGSELPPDWVANPWTSLELLKEAKAMAFTTQQRVHLVKRFGEEKVAAIEADSANLAKALDALGIESKSAEAAAGAPTPNPAPAAAAGETAAPDPAAAFEAVKALLNVEQLQAYLAALKTKADRVPALEAQVQELIGRVEGLGKSDDQKMAEQIQPKIKPMDWGYRPSADDRSKLTDAEKKAFKDKAPTTREGKANSWVGEVFGVS